MLEGYIELFELCIAMVTALLGLAYPLFIDKVNQMSDKYKTRRISEKFKNETAYCCFNILIVVCIVELFVFPIIIIAYDTDYCNQLLITIQGICVFTLSIIMVRLYHLIQTYNDPFRFFNRIRINETGENLIADLQILIQYASNNEAEKDLYNDAMQELMTQILNYQQKQLSIYQQQYSNNEEH